MFTKIVILILVLTLNLSAIDKLSTYVDKLEKLNYTQRGILFSSYSYGMEYGFEYAFTAIAWHESNFGVYMFDLHDGYKYEYIGSYGPYHVLLNNVMVTKKNASHWLASRVAERLCYDITYSQQQAMNVLLYFQQYWRSKGVSKVYSKTLASYNAGFVSMDSSVGKAYRDEIILRTKALKIFFSKHKYFKPISID